MYVRNDLKAKVLLKFKTSQKGKPKNKEFLFCAIWIKRISPFLVAVINRPPDVLLRNPEFLNALRTTCPEYSQKIIMGALNANLMLDSADTRYLWDLVSELSLKVFNHGPTHFPLGGRPSRIDLMCVDSGERILSVDAGMPNFHSFHAKIEVTLESFLPSHMTKPFTYVETSKK